MEDFPRTLMELEQRFSSEQSCREYLYKLRWPKGFQCKCCGCVKCWPLNRGLHECSKCGYQVSITSGTIFQDTKKPLILWFRAVWHITSQQDGANALGLQRILGFGSYRTAWSWLHKLRRAMVRPGRDRLTGPVEVDETYIGGKKAGKRGRGAEGKTLVVIAVELVSPNKIGRIRLMQVPNASAKSLENAVQQTVEPGNRVNTDGWNGYNRLNELGYFRNKVRDRANVGEDMLPACHRVAGLLQRWLLDMLHGAASHEHLPYYLDEFTFRFNRRTSRHRGKLFYRLLQQAMAVDPVPIKSMIKHVRGQKPHYKM